MPDAHIIIIRTWYGTDITLSHLIFRVHFGFASFLFQMNCNDLWSFSHFTSYTRVESSLVFICKMHIAHQWQLPSWPLHPWDFGNGWKCTYFFSNFKRLIGSNPLRFSKKKYDQMIRQINVGESIQKKYQYFSAFEIF